MERQRTNGMTVAALVLGSVTVLFCSSLFVALTAGGVGMTLALLSRGDERMSFAAKVAFIICVVGAVASLAITMYILISMVNSGAMDYYMHLLDDTMRQQYL